MTGPLDRIRKVRFRKRDITPLHTYPSASEQPIPRARRKPRQVSGRRYWRGFAIVVFILSLGLGGAYLALLNGISSQWLSNRAQTVLSSFLGPDLDAKLSNTNIALDAAGNIALEADKVSIISRQEGKELVSAGSIKLGVGAWKLLFGEVEVTRVEVNDAVVDATGDAGSQDMLAGLRDADGRLSAPKLVSMVFEGANAATKRLSASARQKLSLNRVQIRSGSQAKMDSIDIETAELGLGNGGSYEVTGSLKWRETAFSVSGILQGADSFSFKILDFPVNLPAKPGSVEPDGTPSAANLTGTMAIDMDGSATGGVKVLRTVLGLKDLAANPGRNRIINGSSIVQLELRSDSPKLEVTTSFARFGANYLEFTGAVVPKQGDQAPGYDFELVSSRISLKPEGSPEAALDASAVLRGDFDPDTKILNLNDAGIRTLSGEAYAKGTLTFVGTSPRAVLGIRIPRMSVSHAKQIWPVNVAYNARKWVLEKVYGGFIADSAIDLNIPENRYGGPSQAALLGADELDATFNVLGARFDIAGDLPPIRDAKGVVHVRGVNTDIALDSGTSYLEDGQTADVSKAVISIPYERGKPVVADVSATVSGKASAIASIADRDPVNAMKNAPFAAGDLGGDATVTFKAQFPLKKDVRANEVAWSADIGLNGVDVAKPFDGQKLTDASGTITATKRGFDLKADAKLNGLPAKIRLKQPLGEAVAQRQLSVQLELNEKARAALTPGLNQFVKGPVYVDFSSSKGNGRQVTADLTKATIALDFAGWAKGPGVTAAATFTMTTDGGRTRLTDFDLSGDSFAVRGNVSLDKSGLVEANLPTVRLVRGDKASAKITRTKGGYAVKVTGDSLDVRALLKKVTGSFDAAAKAVGSTGIAVDASIGSVTGFGSEVLGGLQMSYAGRGSRIDRLDINATTDGGGKVAIANRQEGGERQVTIRSGDAGSLLRFFDYYDKMRGGSIAVNLASSGDGPLRGSIDAQNFSLVNEPRMRSLVGGAPQGGGPSLKDAVKKDIDVSIVKFSKGYADIQKGEGFLALDNGILRGDLIGLAFKGTAYDRAGNIGISGTFMPAYGLNRIFGEIPILGAILGNGQDRGLIGITFKLSGKASKPQLSVNPISIIAPGIFRQIFEFR